MERAMAELRAQLIADKGGEEIVSTGLRHTFVSDAHDVGLSSGVIMAHTGHVQEPTMLRYLRVSAPAQQRAQEQMDAYRRQQAEQVRARAKKVARLGGRRG